MLHKAQNVSNKQLQTDVSEKLAFFKHVNKKYIWAYFKASAHQLRPTGFKDNAADHALK